MNSPAYYLADLPPESRLNPNIIQEACIALKRNRRQNLADRSTSFLIRTLSAVGEECLNPTSPLRRAMTQLPPEETGFSRQTLERGLDAFFKGLNSENLTNLIRQDLGHEKRLDEICATAAEDRIGRSAMANGPELITHFTAGNLPVSGMQSMVLGLITRSAQFVKCASGCSKLLSLFAHAIHEVEPKIGACIELAEWKGGDTDLEEALIRESDCITASGSNESLAAIRSRVPMTTRFVGHGHRVSFGYITRELLGKFNLTRLVSRSAEDVTSWNQLGCLSPHLFYVEENGPCTAEAFAEALAAELARREIEEPRGPVPVQSSAAIATRRNLYQIRAAASPGTRIWSSEDSTAWTVVLEPDPHFQLSCLDRFVYVKGVASLEEALEGADQVRGQVSTVGLAATDGREAEIATRLARWGATRVCPIGKMQQPSMLWRHDGRPSLGELITWTDWERE